MKKWDLSCVLGIRTTAIKILVILTLTLLGHSKFWATHFTPQQRYVLSSLATAKSLSFILSENLPSTRFSEVISDSVLGMWHPSRTDNGGRKTLLLVDTSAYLHRDVRFGQPFRRNRAQDVQKLSITPMHHRHLIPK